MATEGRHVTQTAERPACTTTQTAPNPTTRYELMDRLIENTDFGFAAHLPSDEVVNSLASALQAVVALPPSPAASALARRTLAEVHRIQAAARLSSIIAFVEREFRL